MTDPVEVQPHALGQPVALLAHEVRLGLDDAQAHTAAWTLRPAQARPGVGGARSKRSRSAATVAQLRGSARPKASIRSNLVWSHKVRQRRR
jgi:hypothetical protein